MNHLPPAHEYESTTYILIHSHTFSCILMDLIHSYTHCFSIMTKVCVVVRMTDIADGEGACVTRGHPSNVSQHSMTHPHPHEYECTSYILIHSYAFSCILMHSHASHTFTYILLLNKEEGVCRLKNDRHRGWRGGHVSPEATRLM